MAHPAAKGLDQSPVCCPFQTFQPEDGFVSPRQVQGPAHGWHEEPRSPGNPGKLISEEYELPWKPFLIKKKEKKKENKKD